MSRVQVIVCRQNRLLLIEHRRPAAAWWCLPGGAIEAGETPEQAALRELQEECRVTGTVRGWTAVTTYGPDDRHFPFWVDIGDQEPSLGHDPELARSGQILHKLAWMRLDEVPPLDRVYLWTAGLLAVPGFLDEARRLAGGYWRRRS